MLTEKSQSTTKQYATGRRKESSARVWIARGVGKVTVNDRALENYFTRQLLRTVINQPFAVTGTVGQYDVFCTVKGGGTSGQAGAIMHGITRALDAVDPNLHSTLHTAGLLERDSRTVERKKYGRKKARKRFQFSKR